MDMVAVCVIESVPVKLDGRCMLVILANECESVFGLQKVDIVGCQVIPWGDPV